MFLRFLATSKTRKLGRNLMLVHVYQTVRRLIPDARHINVLTFFGDL